MTTPFQLIDDMHHGRWDDPFPDPVQKNAFIDFLHISKEIAPSFLIRYAFEDDMQTWSAWQKFDYVGEETCQADALYLPVEDAEDRDAVPEGLDGLPVFEFEWPDGIDWTIPDEENADDSRSPE